MFKPVLLAMSAALAAPSPAVVSFGSVGPGVDAVSARIGGEPGRFLFDSGGGTSLVTPDFARRIGCTPWGKITGFRATGERIDLQRCPASPISVGGKSAKTRELAVFDLARVMGPHPPALDGLIALDAFDGQTVTLSVAQNRLTIETAASTAEIAAHAIPVPVRFVRDAQGAALTVDMGVPTSKGLLWMEVDTGNAGPSFVDQHVAELLGLSLDKARVLGQSLDAPLARGARLSGPVQVGDFILDGNLGRGFLRRWDVTFDLAHSRGWISPSRSE